MPFDPSEPSPIPNLPEPAWPTNRQLAAIGSVAAAWPWLDLALETLLCTLSQSDQTLSQALTEDLSPDNRIKALKRIATTWERLLGHKSGDFEPLLKELRAIAGWLANNKARRNRIVHSLWMRQTDAAIFGWKHNTMPAEIERQPPTQLLKPEEAWAFSREIGEMVGRITTAELAAQSLPALQPPSLDRRPSLALASLLAPYQRREVP